jgi:hypothetical protein
MLTSFDPLGKGTPFLAKRASGQQKTGTCRFDEGAARFAESKDKVMSWCYGIGSKGRDSSNPSSLDGASPVDRLLSYIFEQFR